jgi:hypothetical protein
MGQRTHRTLRPVINDAAEITDAEHGAIVVYVSQQLRDSVCIIVHLGYVLTAVFEDRSIKRRSYTCALFAHVKPGWARLECSATRQRAEVTVEVGKVCQVDWRT